MYAELRNYFENIAISHKEIQHSDSNNRFFPGSYTQFLDKLKSTNSTELMLWLDYAERNPTQNQDDRRITWSSAFSVFTQYDTRKKDFNQFYGLQDNLHNVAMQIIQRMTRDYKLLVGGVFEPEAFEQLPSYQEQIKVLRFLDPFSFQLNDADPVFFNGRIGTRVEFSLQTSMPEYENDNWNFDL